MSAITQQLAFAVLSLVALAGALGVVSARSVFSSALFLIFSLFGVAGLYVLLDASFLAVVQILVYVGAISVLFIFAVMLTPHVMGEERQINEQWHVGAGIALVVFGLLAVIAYRADWPLAVGEVIPASGAMVVTEADGGPAGMDLDTARQIPGAVESRDEEGEVIIRVPGTIDRIGRAFVNDYLLPFEIISVILLVALVGAIAIARE